VGPVDEDAANNLNTESPTKRSLRRGSVMLKKLTLVGRSSSTTSLSSASSASVDTIEKFYLEFDKEDDRTKVWQGLNDAIQALHATKKDLAQRVNGAKAKVHAALIIAEEDSILSEGPSLVMDKRRSKRMSVDLNGTFIAFDKTPQVAAQHEKLYKALSSETTLSLG